MKFWKTSLLTALVWVAAPSFAADHELLVAYRQQMMEAATAHLRAVKLIVVEGLPREGDLAGHGRALSAFGERLAELFPPGSGGGESEAEPAVWDDREGFARAVEAFRAAAGELERAARGGGDHGAAYYRTLDACKGCHKGYRAR